MSEKPDASAFRLIPMTIHRKRFLLLVVYALIALPFVAFSAVRVLKSNANSPLDWMPETMPAKRTYSEFTKQFESGDVVVMSWPGCTIDEPKLDRVAQSLRRSKVFHDEQEAWYFDRVVSGREVAESLMAEPVSLSREKVMQRLRGSLIGDDGQTTCLVIAFNSAGLKRRGELVPYIRAAAKKFADVPTSDLHLAGPVIDGLSVDEASQRTMDTYAAPSAIVTLIVACFCLRSIRSALLVFGLSVFCQLITLACVDYAGESMNALLIVLPPLVQVIMVAGGIHLVNYFKEINTYASGEEAARQVLSMAWLPCFMSAVTSVIGLASLLVSPMLPIRSFGLYSSIGVLVSAAVSLTFIPGVLSLFGRKSPTELASVARGPLHCGNSQMPSSAEAREPLGQAQWGEGDHFVPHPFWDGLARIVERWHRPFIVVCVMGMIACGLGLPNLKTSIRIETLFAPDSRVMTDYRWLEEHVGPRVPIEVLVRFDRECELPTYDRVLLVNKVHRELSSLSGVSATLSAMTYLPDPKTSREMPAIMRRKIAAKILDDSLPHFDELGVLRTTDGDQTWRITAFVSAVETLDYGQFVANVRAHIDPLLKDDDGHELANVAASCTGIMPLVHEIQRQLLRDLYDSFVSGFIVITIAMTIVQAGLLTALIPMITNIFPTLIMFGTLGWLGLSLDIGSVMTASIALGLAIDDELHYLTFFRRELEKGRSIRDAIRLGYRHCGVAMTQTSVTCAVGLSVFSLSEFIPTSRFGWVMAVLIALALFADLLLLPALLFSPLGRFFLPSDLGVAHDETGEPVGVSPRTSLLGEFWKHRIASGG